MAYNSVVYLSVISDVQKPEEAEAAAAAASMGRRIYRPPFSTTDGNFDRFIDNVTKGPQRASVHKIMGYSTSNRAPFDPFGDDPQDKPIMWSGWPTATDLLSMDNDGTENAMNMQLLEQGFEIQPMWMLVNSTAGNDTTKTSFLEEDTYRQSIENVIVSGYFEMESKHSKEKYREWIQNFLTLQDPMVIYTEPSMVTFLMEGRMHAVNRTVFIVARAGSESIDVDPHVPSGVKVQDTNKMNNNSRGFWSLPIRHMYKYLSNTTENFILQNLDRLAPIQNTKHTLFWHAQYAMDDHYEQHKAPSLYWVWLCKSWMVANAIKLSQQPSPLSMSAPFFPSARIFMYLDIGCFRHSGFNDKLLIRHPERVPEDQMLMKAWSFRWDKHRNVPSLIPVHKLPNDTTSSNEDRRIDRYLWNHGHGDTSLFYQVGGLMAGTVPTWHLHHQRFLHVVDRYARAGLFIGEDQVILQQTCLAYPDGCLYGRPLRSEDDSWFAMRDYVHYDYGSLWTPPKVDDTS
jgi:hypothetical protein